MIYANSDYPVSEQIEPKVEVPAEEVVVEEETVVEEEKPQTESEETVVVD